MTEPRPSSRSVVHAAWAAWGGLLLIVAITLLLGSDRTVTPNYWHAGQRWLAGRPLYDQTGSGFIYLPQAAIAFAPFSLMPTLVADTLWRLLTIGAYAYGVRRLASLVGNSEGTALFPLMTAVCLPVAWDGARNGQATLLVTAVMIFAVVDLAWHRWTRAAVWLCLGVAIKPLGTFLLILAAILHRPLRARLLLMLASTAVLPFLAQDPAYVVSQYQAWARMAAIASRVGSPEDWSQLFGMLSVAGVHFSAMAETLTRAAAAALTVGCCVVAARRTTPTQAAVTLFVFHACFLMLFSPRTENNTYAVLAPAIGLFSAQAWLIEHRRFTGAWLAALAMAIAFGYELGRSLLPNRPPNWLAPLMTVCFAAYAISRLWSDTRSAALEPEPAGG